MFLLAAKACWDDARFLRIKPVGGLELEFQIFFRPAFTLLEKEHIHAHAERNSKLPDGVQRGLGLATFIRPDLRLSA